MPITDPTVIEIVTLQAQVDELRAERAALRGVLEWLQAPWRALVITTGSVHVIGSPAGSVDARHDGSGEGIERAVLDTVTAARGGT